MSVERDIFARFTLRYCAFLRRELEELPGWHPLHHEYSRQLRELEREIGVPLRCV